ncbi:MAG: histidine kinase [Gammaproteobacteria bacterium]|nr:histidine kinase [Gammaproteobacteria bacterium]
MCLLAMVMLLMPGQRMIVSWASLGMLAMFLQWLGLLSLTVLCVLSPLLRRMGILSGSILTFASIQLVTLVVSEAAYQLTQYYATLAYMAPQQHSLFLMRNLAISVIISGIALRYMYLQRQLQVRIEAENQAKIQALQARIRPHFLFNSMNTIAALTHVDAYAAEKAILDLSEIYRATLNADDAMTTLAEEVALTRHYLEVEKLRLRERLSVDWQIDEDALQARLPSLVIQPLVENAVYHGIEPRPDGGTVNIQICHNDKLHITITNPLPSRGDDTVRRGNQMAIRNICERLRIAFGKQAALKSSQDESEYHVAIEIPVERI